MPSIAAPTVALPEARGNGSLVYRHPIDLPAFRGIEPALALNYESSRKARLGGRYQGWIGEGWAVSGLEVIERGRRRGGVPAFSDKDMFFLNGEELVACGQAVASPSCAAGGTHATESENYQRVRFDSAANVWELTDGEGIKTTLASVGALSGAGDEDLGSFHDALSRRRCRNRDAGRRDDIHARSGRVPAAARRPGVRTPALMPPA